MTAQESELGVDMGDHLVLSAVGQADDTVLMSHDIIKLNLLLHLAKIYCDKFNVQLSQSKTKLLLIPPPQIQTCVSFNPIKIDDKEVQFVDQADHVGMVRAKEGNMPNIFKRDFSFQEISWESGLLWLSKRTQIQPSSLPSHYIHLLHTCLDVRSRKPTFVSQRNCPD